MSKKPFLAFLILIILLPALVSASLSDIWTKAMGSLGGYSLKDMFYLYVIPFLGTCVIVFGLLSKFNIFDNKKVNIILSLLFAIALLYTGTMLEIARFMYSFGAFAGTMGFFIIFLIGIWMHGKGKMYGRGGWQSQYRDIEINTKELKSNQEELGETERKIDHIGGRLRNIASKIERMDSPSAKRKLVSLEAKLKQEKISLEEKIGSIKDKIENAANRLKEASENIR